MDDLQKAAAWARMAQANGREISDTVARVIASMYHNGQASGSYSLASTGRIVDGVWREMFPNYAALTGDEQICADMMGTYLSNRADKGKVEGWSKLWL